MKTNPLNILKDYPIRIALIIPLKFDENYTYQSIMKINNKCKDNSFSLN